MTLITKLRRQLAFLMILLAAKVGGHGCTITMEWRKL